LDTANVLVVCACVRASLWDQIVKERKQSARMTAIGGVDVSLGFVCAILGGLGPIVEKWSFAKTTALVEGFAQMGHASATVGFLVLTVQE